MNADRYLGRTYLLQGIRVRVTAIDPIKQRITLGVPGARAINNVISFREFELVLQTMVDC